MFKKKTIPANLPSPENIESQSSEVVKTRRFYPEFWLLLAAATLLYVWGLSKNGYANTYYSAAVKAMTQSWSNFFYGSFDSAGVMIVDKPPAALWVQAMSARVFGFSSLSMLVPQALMGAATVGFTYAMTRRVFGRVAATVAGLALLATPIAVAMSRHNNPDALLTLTAAGALWAFVVALQTKKARFLVLAGALIGLGFETKMAAGIMVAPAIYAAWLWMAPNGRLKAVQELAYTTVSMLAVGLAWPVAVWLTPSADRPWISGTTDNSIWSLITGYNGLGRLFGQSGGPGGNAGGGPGGGGPGGSIFGGDPGILRLFNEALGGQIGWLVGSALAGGVVILVASRLRRSDQRTGWLIAVGGSFLTIAIAFSRASGIFHAYYTVLLAPMIAALVGAGIAVALAKGRENDTLGRVAATGLVAGGALSVLLVLRNQTTSWEWFKPLMLIIAGISPLIFILVDSQKVKRGALAVLMALVIWMPASWAIGTVGHATSGTFPTGGTTATAGPGGMGGPGGMPGGTGGAAMPGGTGGAGGNMFGGSTTGLTEALALAAKTGDNVAVSSQQGASDQIINGTTNLVAIGGFSGRESEVSASWLADMVENGKVRYVLTTATGMGGPQDSRVGSKSIMTTVESVGLKVSSVDGLYDLKGLADKLRSAR